MFRPMRRAKQEMTKEQCDAVLCQAPRGVLSLHGEDGYPYGFPMNHIYLDGKLYFHSAKEGHKVDALSANSKASFCVMDDGYREEGHWELNIQSVIVFGTLELVEHQEEAVAVVRKLALKHYPDEASFTPMLQRCLGRFHIYRLTIHHMTGKLVNEA